MNCLREKSLPGIHFARKYGWLNDPNGLVYHDGVYELYFQANPDGIEWDDMTWGHARSRDLIHWEELDPVLYPDENGMMFSGCGLQNVRGDLKLPTNTLLFPYTAAHFDENTGKPYFTIRLAYSTDGGDTLEKMDGTILTELAEDNRDPKVFWHEESGAYILVLWVKENDFGIFRSKDFKQFELSQMITLDGGFECPDLFELPVIDEDGNISEKRWVFWAADGMYVVGDFDGYCFRPVQNKKKAYFDTGIPYAAQTWSGDPHNRVIQIPWLRTKCIDRKTTGTMGIPRVLSLKMSEDGYVLRQPIADEIKNAVSGMKELKAGENYEIEEGASIYITIEKLQRLKVALFEENGEKPFAELEYIPKTKIFMVSSGRVSEFINLGHGDTDNIEMIYDMGIIETTKDDVVLQITDFPQLRGIKCDHLRIEECEGIVKAGIIKA